MVFWLNKYGQFRYVNQRTCEVYEYSKAELLKMDIFAIVKDFTHSDWLSTWKSLKEKKHLLFVYHDLKENLLNVYVRCF